MSTTPREPRPKASEAAPILLTGATGYIGGRLLGRLEETGLRVRCLTRRPSALEGRVAPTTGIVEGNVHDPVALGRAMSSVRVAYYLVHSMGQDDSFEERDRAGAESFARAAREAGLDRIVYLGGLGTGDSLSAHLASRQEVGRILGGSGVPTLELRASIIIGSGSLPFEIIRGLVDKLPVMITPRWVRTQCQPIAIEDVIGYLFQALDIPLHGSRVVEIGGGDQASYGEIMREYARQRGLRRVMIPVPVLSPGISSLWLALFTPAYARIGRKLVESLRNATVVTDTSARGLFSIRPRGLSEAISRALANEDREFAETRWSDAFSSTATYRGLAGMRYRSRVIDTRYLTVSADPAQAFRPIRRIGGSTGWYGADWLWKLRGFLDLLIGGPGLRRGRRNPEEPHVGDTLDFWRVEAYEPDRLLRLSAEMRLPGRAWLQFEVEPSPSGSTIRQTAEFDPRGFLGLAYWYGLYPLHSLIFSRMLRNVAASARSSPLEESPQESMEEL